MKKTISIIIGFAAITSFFACSGSKTKITDSDKSELTKLEIPDSYTFLDETEGDLDGDGNDEKIFVYDTDEAGEYGTVRNIYICKKEKDDWMLWKTVHGPVMESDAGGAMGDPFYDILIDQGKIYISHAGGSSEKWYYNHTYAFVDKEFKLVEAVVDFGRACSKWETYIYNLQTGDLSYDLAPEECEDVLIEEYVIAAHEDYKIKKEKLPEMDGFEPGNNELQLPDNSGAVYY